MRASEVRIGNLIQTLNGIRVVDSIRTDHELDDGEDTINDYIANSVSPIVLSEEWMFKFGFVKVHEYSESKGLVVMSNGKHSYDYRKDEPIIIYNHASYKHQGTKYLIEYIHQFQNYHFAKTGEELVLK